jgi:hypothetical protein
VLLGQQRGGRQDRHLLAAVHRHEGGAQRHLGLAEADVAADQAVHRLGADHVLDHGVDGGALVGRLLEAEAGGEGLVVVRAEAVRMAFARGARAYRFSSSAAVSRTCSAALRGLVPLAASPACAAAPRRR